MVITILTLFPDIFLPFVNSSIIKRAVDKKFVKIKLINIRDYALDRHKSVDDRPYGGGPGMIIRVDILFKALQSALNTNKEIPRNKTKVVILDPRGKTYTQNYARSYSKFKHLILICGHYEGIDERIKEFTDEKISIGKYILTGGELPALVILDSVIRLIDGVISNKSLNDESFNDNNLLQKESPQYTRPLNFKGLHVPEVLVSGNHRKIEDWKKNHRS